ncbi:MAG: 4Fe-4S dicluster domain-containing protein [Gammaproteobacteria bacterium]|nr:4Fe-4S dicluster domain-containing protein [Gammaproteobacteria bacterium]MDH5801934.1 4Fe-4S dicluster domain-containing protein [Gammaproteobacteria bacterium]
MDNGFLPRSHFQTLIDQVLKQGYRLFGPQVENGAIVFKPLQSVRQLPQGWQLQQSPGSYVLTKTDNNQWFDWTLGPQGLKPLLFQSREVLWTVKKDAHGRLHFDSDSEKSPEPAMAVLGVRACDVAALQLQDAHFLRNGNNDSAYAQRRQGLLLLALNCGCSSPTCFCASSGDGPQVADHVDIQLTELEQGFVVRAGSEAGDAVLRGISQWTQAVTSQQAQQALERIRFAGASQSRLMPSLGEQISDRLLDSACWDEVAERCLACGNCTSVCPTCFCYDVQEDFHSPSDTVLHYRQWSSCFTLDHSYMHGLNVRSNTSLQYRQWFVHKLVSWKQQYGRSGCVGCGRCISWCPVGIDITQTASDIHNELQS